ncbi:hypothetical protein CCP3SC1AL1_1200005 [Gammaproteobacteria bacterium]
MIYLSGLKVQDEKNPEGDIKIVYTGLRPGEKLYEELLIGGSNEPTIHPMIRRAKEEFLDWAVLENILARLKHATEVFDQKEIRITLRAAVKGYRPEGEIKDSLWIQMQTHLP